MRIVLRITSGPEAGREIALGPGETRLVGRARKADLRLAEDPYLSDLHMGFYADEAGVCVARDLYSSNGTLLNDEPLEEAILKDGDRVTAGETEIEVRIEAEEEAGEVEEVAPEAAPEALDEPPAAGAQREAVQPYPGIPAVPIEETIVLQEPARMAVAVAASGAVPAWVARPAPAAALPEPPPAPEPVSDPPAAGAAVPVYAQPAFAEIPVQRPLPPPPALLPRVMINLSESPASPPLEEAAAASEVSRSQAASLTHLLSVAAEPLFALVDAARDKSVPRLVGEAGSEAVSLYSGRRAERLASSAPYLLRITWERIPRLTSELWGKSAGIVLGSTRPIAELRAHFKRLLTVETEAGDSVYFRFYDPRVLRVFLPSCTPAQARRFFGPAAWFLVEGQAGGPPIHFAPPPPEVLQEANGAPVDPEPELLILRKEQLELFRRDASERFIDQMAALLKKEHAREVAAWPDVNAAVREAVPRAERYGITSEADLEKFIRLMAALGPKFDEDEALPWAGEILRRQAVGPRKLAALKKALTERRIG